MYFAIKTFLGRNLWSDRGHSYKDLWLLGFVTLIGFALSFALLGPLRNSKIALVDENDIPYYMGVSGKVTFGQIPKILMDKTEVGTFGESSRMRPVAYTFRVIETALWGNEGEYWYTLRIMMFGVVIAIVSWIYIRLVGVFLGIGLIAFTLSFRMWADIWARSTSPTEQYASLGAAVFAVGGLIFIDRLKSERTFGGSIVLMSVGAIVAMGSKENMLILEAPLALALCVGIARRKLGAFSATLLFISIAVGLYIALSIAVYMHNTRVEDLYGNSINVKEFIGKIMFSSYIVISIASFILIYLFFFVNNQVNDRPMYQFIRSIRDFPVYFIIIMLTVISQQIFYTGRLPTHMRYDFPCALAIPAMIVTVILLSRRVLDFWLPGQKLGRLINIGVGAALLIYASVVKWELPAAVAANVQRTRAFDVALTKTIAEANSRTDWPIVIRSYNPWDYEIVQALGILFVARGVNNPRFLVHSDSDGEPRTAFESDVLDRVLLDQSRDGAEARGYLPLRDFEKLPHSGCFVIALRRPDIFNREMSDGARAPIGMNCQRLPMSIYWQNRSTLAFE
jgi:hypothetical protein